MGVNRLGDRKGKKKKKEGKVKLSFAMDDEEEDTGGSRRGSKPPTASTSTEGTPLDDEEGE